MLRRQMKKALQNKSWTFLKYAIAEFLMVVVGILFALQINNWNAIRINKESKNNIISEIKAQLQDDLIDIEGNIKGHEQALSAVDSIRIYLQGGLTTSDSLKWYIHRAIGDYTSLSNTTSFDKLKEFGLQYIQNETLRKEVARLYDYQYESLNLLEEDYYPASYYEEYKDKVLDEVEPYLYLDGQNVAYKSVPLGTALSPRFAFELAQIKQWRSFQIQVYLQTKEDIYLVDSLISVELKGE